jgi:hypothetical protein
MQRFGEGMKQADIAPSVPSRQADPTEILGL